MNRYTQGAPAKTFHGKKKKKPSSVGAYSQGAGSSNPVDATTLGGPSGVGMGGGPPGGSSSFTVSNVADTRDRVDPPAAGMQMHAGGSPGTTAQTTVRTQPEFHAGGGLELIGPDGQLPGRMPERMMHATGSPASGPTAQQLDAMAKQLALALFGYGKCWSRGVLVISPAAMGKRFKPNHLPAAVHSSSRHWKKPQSKNAGLVSSRVVSWTGSVIRGSLKKLLLANSRVVS